MNTPRYNALILFGLLHLIGCDQGSQPSPKPVFPDLQGEVFKLRDDLYNLKKRVSDLEPQQGEWISSEAAGYGLVQTRFGAFTVSIKAVTPYLDGYKVKFVIGNLTGADFSGAKITVGWGSHQSREFNVTNRFSSGAFTTTEVALTPAVSEDIKACYVSIRLDELLLRER